VTNRGAPVPTRYQRLRQTVANLAAPAEEQVRYLDLIFVPITGGGSAEGYGNDELALEFDDQFGCADHMIELGELTEDQKEALGPLDALLDRWSGRHNADFWRREALFGDPRWEEVRACAERALASLPAPDRPDDEPA
jgi:hypothetical protein